MTEFPAAVELDQLGKTYAAGGIEQQVLRAVDLTIERGQFVVILGRSGSGKSTLLNLIGAMDRPSSGEIRIDGIAIGTMPENDRTLFRRAHLGFIFQAYNLIPTLSVAENIALPLELNQLSGGQRVVELLAELEIDHKADASPEDLSGGEQQRVAIARALIHSPNLILADEPTGNLDVDTAKLTIKLLDELIRRNSQTLVMATHSREVIGYADRVLKIEHQQLVDA